jgi:uncharacterized protein with ATP-grasp and redox domains
MDKECRLCLMKSFERLLEEKVNNYNIKCGLYDRINKYINSVNSEITTPEVARGVYGIISKTLQISDLSKEDKLKSNNIVLKQYAEFKNLIFNSDNPYNIALRLSIAGNIMDFAACPEFFTNSEQYLNNIINEVLKADFAIDDSQELKNRIKSSKTLLFLGDNAGEIVFDKLFLETINHSNVYYAVRGKPVINDITVDDARYVGIDKIAKVISNGYDAPSTIIEKTSKEFKRIYNDADLIISKGQGNLEGLINNTRNDLYFLLMVKCDVIANLLAVKKGDYIVKKNNR